ncbi:c-type heme family protein [Planctomicrobium sp. SH527]|uniref:c-type heme family protein n=1 Tax=Planctomicrobium sp. SH527 TaxID=3448123 RepID=UPI003F5B9BE0
MSAVKVNFFTLLLAISPLVLSTFLSLTPTQLHAEERQTADAAVAGASLPGTVEEARGRAKLLHEMIHGSLQVMHRDFFDDEKSFRIPSRSLEDVFSEMERTHQVKMRWIVVNAKAMSIDNKPEDEFEKTAAKEIASGKGEYEAVEDGTYRYVGMIRLSSQCLKCHVPDRKSLEDRFAGIVVSMPLQKGK